MRFLCGPSRRLWIDAEATVRNGMNHLAFGAALLVLLTIVFGGMAGTRCAAQSCDKGPYDPTPFWMRTPAATKTIALVLPPTMLRP